MQGGSPEFLIRGNFCTLDASVTGVAVKRMASASDSRRSPRARGA
jgi:hypothetical protein